MSGSPPPTSRGSNQATSPTTPPTTAARSGSRNLREGREAVQGEEDCPVVGRAEQPEEPPEQEAGADGPSGRLGRWGDHEVEGIAQDGARHQHRRRARGQGGHHEFRAEAARQFLEDEGDAAQWGVERHRQTGPRGRALHDAHRRVVEGAALRHLRADGRPHLDGRTFPAERQPGADGEHAPDKLDRQDGERGGLGFAAHHGLDVLHAAARGKGGKALHHPGGRPPRGPRRRHGDHPAHRRPLLRPGDERSAEDIGRSRLRRNAAPTTPVNSPLAAATSARRTRSCPRAAGGTGSGSIHGHGGSVTGLPPRWRSIAGRARRSQEGTWSTMNDKESASWR